MNQLNFVLRWIGTALSFGFFGIGGLLQGVLIHPLIWLVVRNPRRRRHLSRRVVGGSMRLFVWIMRLLGVLDYSISGREHIEPGKSYLILANHPSLIDVVFLLSIFPQADCVVKEAMARNPFSFAPIRAAGYLSNSDSTAMICNAVDRISAGESLIIFPEGTRTQSGGQPVFASGAAAIAVRADCEILPVFIDCEPATLTRQDGWYSIPDQKVRFTAAIQPPLDTSEWLEPQNDRRKTTQKVTERLEDYFLTGLNRFLT
jgi:1-acyl-sn-glycerol-3-phosphate acyltransferase